MSNKTNCVDLGAQAGPNHPTAARAPRSYVELPLPPPLPPSSPRVVEISVGREGGATAAAGGDEHGDEVRTTGHVKEGRFSFETLDKTAPSHEGEPWRGASGSSRLAPHD